MNEEPTNRELMHHIKDIKTNVGEIKLQVQKTNGRVGALENWRWFVMGGLAILAMLVVPVIIYLLTHAK